LGLERVNPDLFPIIGSVTHDEVYVEELRTALPRYRAKINERGRVVDGVTTGRFQSCLFIHREWPAN
jgi:hypothetical protein